MKSLILTKLWLVKKQNFYTNVWIVERKNACQRFEVWQNLHTSINYFDKNKLRSRLILIIVVAETYFDVPHDEILNI